MFCKRPGVARPFLCLVAFLAASRIPVTLSVERLSGWRKLAPNLKERHNLNMADEPENMTLILLREIRGEQERLAAQLARVLGELAEMREQTQLIPQIAGDVSELEREVSDLQITLAATRADIGAHQGNG
ncbi:MAG: hypothetical protein WB610_05430 [Rhodomicrobium sp.]|jgi:polyhydroxyalkanoate synthesis regulator phasin